VKRKSIFLGLVVILAFGSVITAVPTQKVRLKADKMVYDETSQTMYASSNVVVSVDDVSLKSDSLEFNTSKNNIISSGNTEIVTSQNAFTTSYLNWNLQLKKMTLKNLKVSVTPPDSKKPLFMYIDEASVEGAVQSGRGAVLSSCSLDHPHYFLKSDNMEYTPEKHIWAYNTFLYTDLYGIPLMWWAPIYRYELGKRKVIWNFPVIGKKEDPGWGYYVQNTIDYDFLNGKDSSIYLDWFEFKGIGYGIRHQYDVFNQKGEVFGYRLDEQDILRSNTKFEWKNTFSWDKWTLNSAYKKTDAERINVRGRQNDEQKSVQWVYDDLGDKYEWNVSDGQFYNQFYREQRLSLKRTFNEQRDYEVALYKRENFSFFREDLAASFKKYFVFSEGLSMDFDFNYQSQNNWTDSIPSDERLESKYVLRKSLAPDLRLILRIDDLEDLDGDRVTSDIQNKDYFYRLPELTFDYSPNVQPFTSRTRFTMARYQEVKYISTLKKQRIFPNYDDFSVAPNTYIFSQQLERKFEDLPFQSSFSFSTGYSQYIFSVPGKDMFSSDALYTIDNKLTYAIPVGGFLDTETEYFNLQAPNSNSSPFFFFSDKTQQQNYLNERWKFFIIDKNKFYWTHQTSFDWVSNRWKDYFTTLVLKPHHYFEMKLDTGKKLNPQPQENATRFYPTVLNLDGKSNTRLGLGYHFDLALDTNQWVDKKRTEVLNSRLSLQLIGDSNPEYEWQLSTDFTYQTTDQNGFYDLNRYELSTLNLQKREHCRTLTLSYNRLTQEFRFEFKIDAFPDDPVELVKNKDTFRFGGRLNRATEERF